MMTLPRIRRTSAVTLVLVSLGWAGLWAQQSDRHALVHTIDSIATAPIEAGQAAGMSIAVVRGSDEIVLKGYGRADLELDVPTPERAVYEIGSVTKQFTAVAILQLQERGLLSLDDPLTDYLPDYPTQGHRITIRRLLDHTSGIKGYTEMPGFWSTLATRELPRDSLVAMFSAEPFDFPPGEAMTYNNSAYFLLGLIIEKASGQPYEEYITEHLFEPAGMDDSRYCSQSDIILRRARGYQWSQGGLQRAPYLDHTWPYAAGSICSTVSDLVTWNRALHLNQVSLLSAAAYEELITPGTLNDGTRLRYAKGLTLMEPGGRKMISHGGGIFGFVSESRYFPDEDLIIVVLINSTGPASPGPIATAIEQAVLGERRARPTLTFAGDLAPFAGKYQGPARGGQLEVIVSQDAGRLSMAMGSRQAQPLDYVGDLSFSLGPALVHFVEESGAIVAVKVDRISGYNILTRVKQ